MLRDALTLSDVRGPTLVCEPCGRHERYNVERFMAEHGARSFGAQDCLAHVAVGVVDQRMVVAQAAQLCPHELVRTAPDHVLKLRAELKIGSAHR